MISSVHQSISSSVISLAFSPCPNDTFIFDAMVHGKIDTEGLAFNYRMADVEELNHLAMKEQLEMIKVSYHAWLYLRGKYTLLDSGSAMGSGNGPVIIGKNACTLEELEKMTVAVPGEYTTANLLLKVFAPYAKKKKILVFNQIENAVLDGVADAGVLIHENRFTYQDKGLVKIADLGELWEQTTKSPIPLGAIVVKTNLGQDRIDKLNRIMKRSVDYAFDNPGSPMDFVRANAQEMDEAVMRKHISLYVNDYTRNMGDSGKAAIDKLQMVTRNLLNTGNPG